MGMPPPKLIDENTGQMNWKEFNPSSAVTALSRAGDGQRRKGELRHLVLANFQNMTEYVSKLAQQLRGAGYITDPDFSLSEDPDAVDKMMRDPVVNYAVNFRKRLVGGRDHYLEAVHEKYEPYVDIFSALLDRIKRFTQSRFTLAEAVFQGQAIARFDGCQEYLKLYGTDQYCTWWYPKRLVTVDKRRLRREFVVSANPDGTSSYHYAWTIFNPEQQRWYVITNPEWYLWFVYNDEEDRVGHGRGLYDALYVPWYQKTNLRQYMLQFAQRYAEPWIDIQMDAEAGDSDTLTARGQAYIEAIKAMRGGRVLYHDNRDTMQLIDVHGSSQQHITKSIEMLDQGIIQVCLSNTLTTGTGSHGSRAQAEVHEDSQENAVMYDRMLFEEEIDESLLGSLWKYNRANLFRLGHEDVPWDCPLRFRLQKEQKYDPDQQIGVFTLAKSLGVRVREEDFRERFDLPEPGEDEPVLGENSPMDTALGTGDFNLPFKAGEKFNAGEVREVKAILKEKRLNATTKEIQFALKEANGSIRGAVQWIIENYGFLSGTGEDEFNASPVQRFLARQRTRTEEWLA